MIDNLSPLPPFYAFYAKPEKNMEQSLCGFQACAHIYLRITRYESGSPNLLSSIFEHYIKHCVLSIYFADKVQRFDAGSNEEKASDASSEDDSLYNEISIQSAKIER